MDTTDFGLLSPAWAATGADVRLGDPVLVRALLDVEVALATAQAEAGIIPAWAVAPIADAAAACSIDVAELAEGVRATGDPVTSLVTQLTREVASTCPDAAAYVHRGGTSQDILDSAMMLLAAQALDDIDHDLSRCAGALAELAGQHRHTPMVARTMSPHAAPTTFGLQTATWLQLVLDARRRVRVLSDDLPASLGGATGTLAAYLECAGSAGAPHDAVERMMTAFAEELGLRESLVPWHGVRTPLVDIAAALVMTTGALGKLAVDVQAMTRAEIGEVVAQGAPGRGVSPAAPRQHDPMYVTALNTAARQLPAQAMVLFGSVPVADERSAGGWHAEWQALRECLRLASGAAANAAELTAGLTPVPDRMLANLALTGGVVLSERLTTALAPLVGEAAAKHRYNDRGAADSALVDELAGLDIDALRGLLDPVEHTGIADVLVDRVLARYVAESRPPITRLRPVPAPR
jgi:3-carboxy-cis,cis-muconate cycloisomerase